MKKYRYHILTLLLIGAVSFGLSPFSAYAATFGKTDDGTNVQTFSGDRIYLSFFTPASSGTITSCSGRVRLTSAGSTLSKIVIYATSAGEATTYLAQSDEVTVNWTTSADTAYEVSGANEISIVGGTTYALGFWSDDPGVPSYEYKRDNTASVNRFMAVTYSSAGTPTSPFVSDGSSNGPLNVYCTYTESVAGSSPTASKIKGGKLKVNGGTLKII